MSQVGREQSSRKLGERLGGVAIAQGGEQEAEDARLVESDHGFEVVERSGARVCAEV
jgi:hypothetical protein